MQLQTIAKIHFTAFMDYWNDFFQDGGHGSDATDSDYISENLNFSDPSASDSDLEPELETRHHPQPIHHTHTARLRSGIQESEILCKVKKVLCCLQEEGLNLAIFLDALTPFFLDSTSDCNEDAGVTAVGSGDWGSFDVERASDDGVSKASGSGDGDGDSMNLHCWLQTGAGVEGCPETATRVESIA
jgi:hypothetical protein